MQEISVVADQVRVDFFLPELLLLSRPLTTSVEAAFALDNRGETDVSGIRLEIVLVPPFLVKFYRFLGTKPLRGLETAKLASAPGILAGGFCEWRGLARAA